MPTELVIVPERLLTVHLFSSSAQQAAPHHKGSMSYRWQGGPCNFCHSRKRTTNAS